MGEPHVQVRKKPGSVTVVEDAAALHRAAAEEFSRLAREAIAQRGRFAVALSGGNTPRDVYSLLAREQKTKLPWEKVFVFFGDERHVPPDHPESNYRMANEALLTRVPLPAENVYRVPAEFPAAAAADQYEQDLREFFQLKPGEWPRFDLILLGIGEDGHTASLFPESSALQEKSRLVVPNWVEKFSTYRITLTFPVLNHAAEVMFLVSGEGKAKILRDIFNPTGVKRYPAQAVQPEQGKLLWLLDRDAARLVS
jgi:6-phosphogluconolactonase